VSRIHDVITTETRFTRPAAFDLAEHWREAQDAYVQRFGSYPVRLRLRGDALIRAGWAYARSKSLGEPDPDGWVEAEFDTEDWDGAVGLVGSLGGDVIVLAPDRLRRHAIADAARFLELNEP
jgi:predicted DNA-binding transcriptional regulator YafY